MAVDTAPDEATPCKFRHLLEHHQLADTFLGEINAELNQRDLLLRKHTLGGYYSDCGPPFNQEPGA